MAKGNFIEYIVSDNPNKYPNNGEQGDYYYEAMEDVTPEVTTQTPIIQNITEALVGKATGATATADKILEGYSAYVGQQLVNGTLIKSGMYVWKKLTAQGGDFVDFVISDEESAYPDGGTQDGYWYEKVVEGVTGIEIYNVTPTSNTTTITINHNLGVAPSKVFVMSKSLPTITYSTQAIFAPVRDDLYPLMACGITYYTTGKSTQCEFKNISKLLTISSDALTIKSVDSYYVFQGGLTYEIYIAV